MADLSVEMLYRHFKTKEDLYGAMIDMGEYSLFQVYEDEMES